MYLGIISAIFGILFILSGIAGFLPQFFSDGLLYGVFSVDLIHNVANFIIGLIALFSSLRFKRDRLFFQVFGIIFGLLAIFGFVFQGNLIVTQVNMAENVLHFILAVIFLVLGFSASKEGQI
jgi:hypothetical protein